MKVFAGLLMGFGIGSGEGAFFIIGFICWLFT